MKTFEIENLSLYTAKCTQCQSLLKFNIDINNLMIKGECKKGHFFDDISSLSLYNFIKNTSYIINYCYKCHSKINNNSKNYICKNCNILFCSNCFEIHSKEKNHQTKFYNYNLRFCIKHDKLNTLFCEDCKINICEECKDEHNSHCINSFFEGKINEKNNINYDNYKKRIENIINFLTEKKKEVDKRFNILDNFYNCLIKINELLTKFNYSIYDYYNYQNLQNYINFQNKEFFFDETKNLNYLLYGTKIKDNKDNKNHNQNNKLKLSTNNILVNSNLDNKYINITNYKSLRYLDYNRFFLYDQNYDGTIIKFYEYQDFSFKFNFSLRINLNFRDKIEEMHPAFFNDSLFIITKHSKIFILKYNLKEKSGHIHKIYSPYGKKDLIDIIDNINEKYVITETNGLKVFIDHYHPSNFICNIHGFFNSLDNINESMFICNGSYSTYYIFDTKKYNVNKKIQLGPGFKFIGMINNDLLAFTQNFMHFYLYNIKYFEIVQKFHYNKTNQFINICHRSLYEFKINNELIEIRKFSPEKSCFENLVVIIIGSNYNINFNNILYFEDNRLFLTTENKLEIYNY